MAYVVGTGGLVIDRTLVTVYTTACMVKRDIRLLSDAFLATMLSAKWQQHRVNGFPLTREKLC